MRFDPKQVRIGGKKPARHRPGTPVLSKYMVDTQPNIPPPVYAMDWNANIANWPLFDNSGPGAVGDCTCAAAGDQIVAWSANVTGTPLILPDSAILTAYEAVGGYVPGDPSTDQGAECIDVLNYWHTTGIGGDQLAAFAQIDGEDRMQLEVAINTFGGAYLGLALPQTAMAQTGSGVWSVPAGGPVDLGAPGSWGGHCVTAIGYNTVKGLCVITWGFLQWMTWGFWRTYVDEAWAVVSQDWVNQQSGKSPSGFDYATLIQDVNLMSQPYTPT
jgi:hypothetical protein